MPCACCLDELRSSPDIGLCFICSRNMCGLNHYSHLEKCPHCSKYFCYQDQIIHSEDINKDPIQIFHDTATKATEGIKDIIRDPNHEYTPIIIKHGVYLSKKLKNSELELRCKNLLKDVKDMKNRNQKIILDHYQKETLEKLVFESEKKISNLN